VAAKLLAFPERDITDLPRGLRSLADSIEAGKYGDALLLSWVIDCGDADIRVGILGKTAEPAAVGHYLFALAMRQLEEVSP
jgi:hypothetical protein